LLAIPAAWLVARRARLSMAKLADIAGVAIPLGLVFGRLGCFMAGCCHGSPTGLPWGITFSSPASLARPLGTPLHPTQLYASVFALVLFGLMMLLKRRWKRFDGQVFLSFCVLYSSGRFLLELVRNDNRGQWFADALSSSQIVALAVIAVSLPLLLFKGRKGRSEPDAVTPSAAP